ncbi:hypothetical protein HanHA300_Chr03g0075301 [Helianthus annuus]|nr:hypothetical protein HanIR_Chr12g0613761 [Helianthus annuus]KAJ0591617.1 hypothetical protein HanHA300_Chr03g0075301 [Helianthus annuus]KAJ0606511.1 hypothetical protein HanHA89_Chr03g0085951 [Helianthus annuus]
MARFESEPSQLGSARNEPTWLGLARLIYKHVPICRVYEGIRGMLEIRERERERGDGNELVCNAQVGSPEMM